MRCGVIERGPDGEYILVIGYGNQQRGDDGIGPRVAETIAAVNHPGVRVRSVFQLVPELAAELAEAQIVIFVDALVEASHRAIKLEPIAVEVISDWGTHSADPRTLLALTRAVYRRAPEAWWLTVPGREFGLGEGLSSAAEGGVRQAIARIRELIQTKTRTLPLEKRHARIECDGERLGDRPG
jgi:hydrogenase maturation protease